MHAYAKYIAQGMHASLSCVSACGGALPGHCIASTSHAVRCMRRLLQLVATHVPLPPHLPLRATSEVRIVRARNKLKSAPRMFFGAIRQTEQPDVLQQTTNSKSEALQSGRTYRRRQTHTHPSRESQRGCIVSLPMCALLPRVDFIAGDNVTAGM